MWFYVGADGAPQAGIWDCMMQEGIKVLFRVILGLFKTYQDEILRNRIPVLAQDPVMVLDIGFNLRGFRGHDLREGRREALKHLDEYVHTPRTPRPEESSYILTEQVAPLKQRLISLLSGECPQGTHSATSTNYLDDGSRTSTSTLDIVPRIFVPLRVKGDAPHRSIGSIRSLMLRTESMAPVSGDNPISQSSLESRLTPPSLQRFRPPLPADIRVYPVSSYDSLTPATEDEEEESPKSLTFAAESTTTPQSCIRVDRLVEDFGSLLRAQEFSSVSPRFENGEEMAWCSCCNFHT
ncbi:MAG: uncharacterized protein KVP18_001594 [Porospora cf. gigantea A]|uniref:uncharacterized protein n=1 Tax=Porospora cf. gigantea A TaxID=2853593 RepID=UPI00355AC20F|nr:MAG: hypothetical protein KVP18_001594 [Porospora cf. gigantea A]